ncbi:MAG: hypothetical protein HOV68_13935, partial [Streptomycetaceae bacterium]|nr:hypothetical protein [Streptomycetaceae bacterium]
MNAQNNADRAKEPRNKNGADATGTPERTPDAALAAARAALAALDKANTENASNRGELAAAWQALTALGEEHGGRDRGPRADEEWAVPVVDAPPTPPSVAEPPRPA